jgi:hypothetical protein
MLVLLLGACETKPALPPELNIPLEEVNTRVRLTAPSGLNIFQTRDTVELVIEFVSGDQIAFDYGARTFIYQDQQWVEVENAPTTYPEGKQTLSLARGDLQARVC